MRRRDEPDEARRRALEARVYGDADVSPDDVRELRALLGGAVVEHATGDGSAEGHAADPAAATDADAEAGVPNGTTDFAGIGARVSRRPRVWLAGAAVAVVLAAAIGAGATASVLRSRDATSAMPGATTAVIGSPGPSAGGGPVTEAESLGHQYFDQAQTTQDRPPIALPRIEGSTTRRVLAQFGQRDGEASVWVARGTDDSFCLIMAVGTARAASSCTPERDVVATGVHLDMAVTGDGSISATWNLASGLLELSPFPSGADAPEQSPRSSPRASSTGADTQSGGGHSTP